jgi:hypothetical protein
MNSDAVITPLRRPLMKPGVAFGVGAALIIAIVLGVTISNGRIGKVGTPVGLVVLAIMAAMCGWGMRLVAWFFLLSKVGELELNEPRRLLTSTIRGQRTQIDLSRPFDLATGWRPAPIRAISWADMTVQQGGTAVAFSYLTMKPPQGVPAPEDPSVFFAGSRAEKIAERLTKIRQQ